jgi:hypothetical protein
MKILLDENLPRKLKTVFGEHEVFTVDEMGWQGKKNGELLSLLHPNGFDAFLTCDKNIRHQQNLEQYDALIIQLIAGRNTFQSLQPLVPKILAVLNSGKVRKLFAVE